MFSDQRIVIGCPLSGRQWCLGEWFAYAISAVKSLDIQNYEFAFVVDRGDPVQGFIAQVAKTYDVTCHVREVDPYLAPYREHHWSIERLEYMVYLRNQLLNLVRELSPDLFLSMDSDILLSQIAFKNMLESIEDVSAVGGKVYLHRLSRIPSYANIGHRNNQLLRPDVTGVFKVDVIMALKLMKPAAYNVDYEFDKRGEDIGWGKACKEHKLKILYDGRVASKHVMEESMISKVDRRLGW